MNIVNVIIIIIIIIIIVVVVVVFVVVVAVRKRNKVYNFFPNIKQRKITIFKIIRSY